MLPSRTRFLSISSTTSSWVAPIGNGRVPIFAVAFASATTDVWARDRLAAYTAPAATGHAAGPRPKATTAKPMTRIAPGVEAMTDATGPYPENAGSVAHAVADTPGGTGSPASHGVSATHRPTVLMSV